MYQPTYLCEDVRVVGALQVDLEEEIQGRAPRGRVDDLVVQGLYVHGAQPREAGPRPLQLRPAPVCQVICQLVERLVQLFVGTLYSKRKRSIR